MAQAKPTAKTAQEAAKALSALPADVSATEIKKSHIVAARDTFARTGSAGTVAKKLGLIGAVFQAAVDDELFGIVVNPRIGVRVRGAPPEQRAQWTIARLNDVLQVLWQQGEPREDYWLVLGLAFAGSRLLSSR